MNLSTHKPLRVGVVGAGNFGKLHINTLLGLDETELAAVVVTRQASKEAVNRQYPQTPCYTNLQEAIQTSGAQAWIVTSASASHVPVSQAILSAGLPVLIEKPLATSVEQGRLLAPLVKPDSSNLMMGHILLFNSEYRVLHQQMATRSPLRYIQGVRHRPASLKTLFPGESPLHLTMTHDLYVTQTLVNFESPRALHATIQHDDQGRPDLVTAQLTWSSGVSASLTASFLAPEGMPEDGFDRMEVFGQDWAARLSPNPRPIDLWDTQHRAPMSLEILPDQLAPSGMLAEELRCFCRVVQGRQPVPPGARYQDAMQMLEWLDALALAAGESHA